MQRLNIVAASPESARALLDALSEFDVEVIHASDGDYQVSVTLGGRDREIVAVLNALEQYIIDRGHTARVNLDGREYVMHPDPAV